MKYKILLSLLVVSVLGCGDRVFRVDTETLLKKLKGKTRQEIKALYGTPTCVWAPTNDSETWFYDDQWVDEVNEHAFKSCSIQFGRRREEMFRVEQVKLDNEKWCDSNLFPD